MSPGGVRLFYVKACHTSLTDTAVISVPHTYLSQAARELIAICVVLLSPLHRRHSRHHITMVDRGNRERGLKAAIHNPRVSEQAKQRDREILATEFGEHLEEGPAKIPTEQSLPLSPDEEYSSSYLSSPSPPVAGKSKLQTSGLTSSAGSGQSQSATEPQFNSSGMSDTISSSAKSRVRRASAGAASSGSAIHGGIIDGKDSGNVSVQ